MHYHMEVVLPPGYDYETRIEQAMAHFDGNNSKFNSSSFWDWYVIGGRWSGTKLESRAPEGAIDEFRGMLRSRHFTVSGITCGKPTLEPASQIAEVDRLWREAFPGLGITCPLFDHYKGSVLDVCTVAEIPERLECYSFAVATLDYTEDEFEFKRLQHKAIWNGCDHQDTTFSGNVRQAIADHNKKVSDYKAEYARRLTVDDSWLCVTLDYHT